MNQLKMLLRTTSLGLLITATSSYAIAAPVDYQIDPGHTATVFSWTHFGFSNPSANFSDIQGTIHVDEKNPANSSVDVTIPVKSINSNVAALDKEFLTDKWFDAAKYPNITFKSTKVVMQGKNNFSVLGNLTVKGVTKPVTLKATLNGKGEHPMAKKQAVGFNATTSFKRSDFGIAQYIPSVSDEIKVNITTEALVK